MKKAKWERNGHTIKDLATGKREPFASVCKAKRRSRQLQMVSDKALGRGTMRLAT